MRSENILRKKEDFENLRKKGKSYAEKNLIFVYLKNDLSKNRKAFLASKKVGNSVQRHRAIRLLREAFSQIEKENDLALGYDFLLIARSSIINVKCADVKENIKAALKKSGL